MCLFDAARDYALLGDRTVALAYTLTFHEAIAVWNLAEATLGLMTIRVTLIFRSPRVGKSGGGGFVSVARGHAGLPMVC